MTAVDAWRRCAVPKASFTYTSAYEARVFGKFFFLTFFPFPSWRLFVGGVFFIDAYGLAFFFGIEAEVFEQEHLAGLEGGSQRRRRQRSRGANCTSVPRALATASLIWPSRHFGVHFAFGLAHVAHDNERTAVFEDFLKGGESAADTGVVGDVSVLVQGHIEVNAYDGFSGR